MSPKSRKVYTDSLDGGLLGRRKNQHSFSFRLLTLFPGPRNAKDAGPKDEVKGTLSIHLLEEAPSYKALSYAWGRPNEFVKLDLGAGKSLPISRHLDDGLRQLRDPDNPIHVWVDAICINQKNNVERSYQVSIMHHIYNSAHSVYVWLGNADGRFPDSVHIYPDFEPIYDYRSKCWIHIDNRDIPHLISNAALAWWNRKWILQEVVAARMAPFVLLDGCLFEGTAFALEMKSARNFYLSEFSAITAPWAFRERMREGKKSEDISSANDHLAVVLHQSVNSYASNSLDYIYSILGLASEHQRKIFKVNYKKTPEALFTDVSRFLWTDALQNPLPLKRDQLTHGTTVDLLVWQWERFQAPWPSWACNFSDPSTCLDWKYFTGLWKSLSQDSDSSAIHDQDRIAWNEHFIKRWPEQTLYKIVRGKRSIQVRGLVLGIVKETVTGEYLCRFSNSNRHGSGLRHLSTALAMPESAIEQIVLPEDKPGGFGTTYFERYAFFSTTNGHVGVCRRTLLQDRTNANSILPQDLFVFLEGASAAFVLRKLSFSSFLNYRLTARDRFLLVTLCMLSNDVCGCGAGKSHDESHYESMILC